jgi:integrase
MARTNSGVSFHLKTPNAETSVIRAVFSFANQQMPYYEKKLSVPTKFWNKNAQRAKETKSFFGYSELNNTLNKIETTILDTYRRFKNEHHREPLVEELRELVKEKRAEGSTKPAEQRIIIPSLLTFVSNFIEEAKEGKHLNLASGKPVSIITIRSYSQTHKLLSAFAKHKKKAYKLEDVDANFHKQFIHFMTKEYASEETGKPFGVNTAGKHISNLKTFMNVAVERKLTANLDFRMRSFKVIKEDVEKIYLSELEIDALASLDLSKNKRLEKARDMFIVGCHTALRVSDLKRLTKNHVIHHGDDLFIRIEMKKTEKPVTIPINEDLEKLMNRYLTSTGQYFPKVISDQKMNDYIKEAAEKVDLLRQEVIINKTVDGRRVSESVPKYTLITNHTARRSFATNAALRGIPYQFIMPITGHKTEKAFLRYIKIDGLDAAKMFKLHISMTNLQK